MNQLLQNYINGNLTDATRQAKRFSYSRILVALYEAGYGPAAAIAIAAYLKRHPGATFQAACDAEAMEKGVQA